MHATEAKSTLDGVEQLLKIFALSGGGLFFAWKIVTGWLIINLKVSLRLERSAHSTTQDHLGITVYLEKGTTDSVWLQAMSVRVSWLGIQDPKLIDLSKEFLWLEVRDNRINWSKHDGRVGAIALAPGESTTVGWPTTVPRDAAVRVELAAYGKRAFWARGFQWRASAISLPTAMLLQAAKDG